MPIARAVSAKFKAFLFPVIESYSVVPVFRSSVIPRFPVSRWKVDLLGVDLVGVGLVGGHRFAVGVGFCLVRAFSQHSFSSLIVCSADRPVGRP